MSSTRKLLAAIAREHLLIPTLRTRRADNLDFHEVAVWTVASALRAAFDAGVASARKKRDEINVHELLGERRQVAVVWSIEDVQGVRPDLNDDQAWKVLQRCDKYHDCELGFNWLLIETVADDLYSEPSTTEQP